MSRLGKHWKLLALGAGILILATRLPAANTNDAGSTNQVDMTGSFLQVQEQLHATQIAIEANRQAAMAASDSNAAVLMQQIETLGQTVMQQHQEDSRSQQLALMMAGIFGIMGLGILATMVFFQWRAFTQLAHLTTRVETAAADRDAVHQLAGTGRAAVEASSTLLLSAVDRLEHRISELETGHRQLPEPAAPPTADWLGEGQKHLDTNAPQRALECFDRLLAAHPNRADAMVKRSAALEKLGRDDEALAGYNRAIVADPTLTIAHLHKGGLLNRLRRYDEALNCYEQALVGQDKKTRTLTTTS